MGFSEAVKSFFSNYATFSGRSRRPAYWWPALFLFLVNLVLAAIDTGLFGGLQILGTIWGLAVLVPSLAVGVRRLHDTDKSGWWILIGLIPFIGTVILIVFFATDSNEDSNQYGDPVK